MIDDVYAEAEEKMTKAVEALQRDLSTMRAGRANPSLLDKIEVDYYGISTPLNQLAGISAPEARLLVIQPWDKQSIPAIEKAIQKSDLGLTPSNDGNVIRLTIPELTEERRKELVKYVKKKTEEGRVSIRNIRRDANDIIKQMEKESEISEDESKRAQDDIQELTDSKVDEVDKILEAKEKEIMEV
ncbi:MAG: ribosome recycling factor [Bacillota bacterium]